VLDSGTLKADSFVLSSSLLVLLNNAESADSPSLCINNLTVEVDSTLLVLAHDVMVGSLQVDGILSMDPQSSLYVYGMWV
jgi:hypothetical protein